jgi:hypothetical protein
MICLLTGLAATIRAASHWSVNPYDFQYDMTVYLQLSATNQDIYEVAAFCGDECRGVGSLMTVGSDSKVFYMRIRSNVAKDEQITFRIYDTVNGKEVQTDGFISFDSQTLIGLPSNPMLLVQKGDVNGDGSVDIADAVCIVNYVVDKPNTRFVETMADANSDNDIDIADAVHIVNFVVGKISDIDPRFGWALLMPQ